MLWRSRCQVRLRCLQCLAQRIDCHTAAIIDTTIFDQIKEARSQRREAQTPTPQINPTQDCAQSDFQSTPAS